MDKTTQDILKTSIKGVDSGLLFGLKNMESYVRIVFDHRKPVL